MALDLLIAIFFFFVGLEIRSSLTHPKQILLPTIAALGGMVIPASIVLVIAPDSGAWATAMPTDLALALAVLSLVGKRIDPSVRLFLLTLAVADDLFSLIALALFYFNDMDLIHSASTLGAAFLGVLVASIKFMPTDRLISFLSPLCTFAIIPIYVISKLADGIEISSLSSRLTFALIAARVIGKVAGITLFSWISLRVGMAHLPQGLTMRSIIGVGLLAGMGLTVSLVIAEVALSDPAALSDVRAGIIISALISGALGFITLRRVPAP